MASFYGPNPHTGGGEAPATGLVGFFNRLRQLTIDLVIIGFLIGVGFIVAPAVMKPTVLIENITVPTALEERGYTGDVISRRLRDELRAIQTRARPTILTALKLTDMSVEQRLPESESAAGTTLRFVITMVREFLDLDDMHISGEVTVEPRPPAPTAKKKASDDENEPPPIFSISLRSRNEGPFHRTLEPTDHLDNMIKAAAIAIAEVSNPVLAARYYEISGRYDDAERVARILMNSRKPEEIRQGMILRGNVLLRHADSDGAIVEYQKVLEEDPRNALAAVNIAWAHYRVRRYAETVVAADRAIAIDPRAASAYAHKSNALRLLGQLDEAIEVAKAGADLEPRNGQPLTALAFAYNAQRRPNEALDAGLRALAKDPEYGSTYTALGLVYRQLGRQQDALAAFKRNTEIDPTVARAWIFYGQALRAAKQFSAAHDALEKSRAIDPKSGELQYERGETFLSLKKPKEALDAFELAKAEGFRRAYAHMGAGEAQFALKHNDEANAEFESAVALQSRDAAIWIAWAEAFLARRNHERGIDILRRAREKMPSNAKLAVLLGDAQAMAKNGVEALAAYRAAIEIDPQLRGEVELKIKRLEKRAPRAKDLQADLRADRSAR